MSAFDDAFAVTVGIEGGYSTDPKDPGNWTGGKCGTGVLKGTKYGISAAAFPGADIVSLTLDQAKQLAKTRYWDVFHCDEFDPRIGFQVFDAAYNGGHPLQWLQQAAGVSVDGKFGPVTLGAIKAADPLKLIMRFLASRFEYWTQCSAWPNDNKGWTLRGAANLRRGAE